MDNQERNREALIDHIAEQDRIIRRRNQQIANQAQNAREAQQAIEEQDARNNSLAADLAAAVVRADKAEKLRDEYRAMHSEQIRTIARLQENPRPLTADDITDEMVQRGARVATPAEVRYLRPHEVREVLTAALTEPPARPEGAEKVEAVLNQYWSGDVDGTDLADLIVEEMNR